MSDFVKVTEIFGENVFNDTVMRERLPKKVYSQLKKTIEEGTELDLATADVIAHEMKEWAIDKGATHYTHWFLPLTGVTAEKHDAFISAPLPNGKVLMSFSGKELIKGEPDASSFPSGGLRATFEARGYTVWDCTSPAFVRQDAAGATLCIPTAFCSYTGEALDQKTPLLRSMEAIDKQALRLLRLFGNTTSRKVTPSVGAEQEYFIVDAQIHKKRPDLIFAGRSLFGAMPPKGQEMDDHYFGTIRQRIAGYMKDVNIELWKLGVSAKTQHNEAAPAQHELAPIYTQANVAVDHNQIIMETLKRIAEKHGLKCLLHEKPFAGVNGSGKHDNWSITTDDGINLLDPGKKPHQNMQFLLILTCILKAVDKHADLLRVSASDPGNDHRLGSNEAPPAIISVFLGEQLEDILQQMIDTGNATHSIRGGKLNTGVSTLTDVNKDATDRNRTSPFAFTGNKFEFRMVGSRDSVAMSNIVLNTIVAEAFKDACDRLETLVEELTVEEQKKAVAKALDSVENQDTVYSKEVLEALCINGSSDVEQSKKILEALHLNDNAKAVHTEKISDIGTANTDESIVKTDGNIVNADQNVVSGDSDSDMKLSTSSNSDNNQNCEDVLLSQTEIFEKAVHMLIAEYATEHQRIVFNGNGYSDEWVKEAERRGLPNLKCMVDAIPALTTKKSIELFEQFNVFTEVELRAREEIQYEIYAKTINIEAKTMIEMASKQLIPAVIKYTTTLAKSINEVRSACGDGVSVRVQARLLERVSSLLEEAQNALDKLIKRTTAAVAMPEGRDQAVFYYDNVTTAMEALRKPIDELEMIVDKELWPYPSYADMLFEV